VAIEAKGWAEKMVGIVLRFWSIKEYGKRTLLTSIEGSLQTFFIEPKSGN
jgi:hypothetical protein